MQKRHPLRPPVMTTAAATWRWRVLFGACLFSLALGCTATIDGGSPPPGAGQPGAGPQGTGGSGTVPGGAGGASVGQGGAAGPNGGAGGASTGTGGMTAGGEPGAPGSGLSLDGIPDYYRFVRLTPSQWEASVRDLLELDALSGLSSGFVPDPPNGNFSNNERALAVTSDLRTDYQRAAEALASQVAGDAQALAKVTGGVTDPAVFVRTFGRRVFRRPLTTEEEQTYQNLFASGATLGAIGDAFADGVSMVIEAMLQSPNFLYRMELDPEGAPLNGYEMASKLSFLLRDTTPDDALLDAASAGELDTAAGVLARATAMLDEPAGETVLGRYHAELFGLQRYNQIAKNQTVFPTYTEALNTEFEQADRMFFDQIFTSGQGLRAILTSPLAFVSSASAPFYGVTATGAGLTEVQLGPERPGILTRLGFLTLNATLTKSDPIHRGVDVVNRLMCAKLQPPEGTIPQLPEIMPDQTTREVVNSFTGPGTCGAGCHGTTINPIGFAFENFDSMGQIRTTDNGKPVDTTGQVDMVDGTKSWDGAPQLTAVLAEAPSVHTCYAMHLAEFTLARDIAGGDQALIDSIGTISMNTSASIKDIVLAIVSDPSFLTRKGGGQ